MEIPCHVIYSSALPVPDLCNQDRALPSATQLLEFLLTLGAEDWTDFAGISVTDAFEMRTFH
jgi:hypothetical protein